MKRVEKKYPFPDFLNGLCHPLEYDKWLEGKTRAHLKRDRKRGSKDATRESYKIAIYDAVIRCAGKDAYTGKPLRWDLISKYDNDAAKDGGREYKKQFGDLPTVDHIGDNSDELLFNICSWRTNDAKNDLTLDEFMQVCKEILEYNNS